MSNNIPVIILKNLIILPNQEIKLELNNLITKKTIRKATEDYKGEILVVAPLDLLEEEPSISDLPKVGILAKIKNKIGIADSIQVRIKGIKRVAVNNYYAEDDILYSNFMYIDLPSLVPHEEQAMLNKLISVLKQYITTVKTASNDILNYIISVNDLDRVTDIIASFLPFKVNKKMEYMQEINPIKRAKTLINDMNEAIASQELDEELDYQVSKNLDNDQREFLLKEKLKTIKEELGETSWKDVEIQELYQKLDNLKLDKKTKEHIEHEIKKFDIMSESSPEISVLRNYLDWVINLPWNKFSNETDDYKKVLDDLNKTHYGMDKIKVRVSEYVAIKKLNKDIASPIICLVGPPGVGKTSIASSIACALNRKFVKISVGGLNDSTELIGTRRTYLASSPGKIIQGISKCGTNNPVILIDEVDKMVKDYKGDPASVLLEILDPVQNKLFMDNYLEVPFDLSNVLFILTANNEADIPLTILDRVEVINLNSYTLFEKKDIAINYLLPRILKENMVNSNIKFSDELLYFIINNYTYEAGVRDLERTLASLARKITINELKSINNTKVVKLLGNPKYNNDILLENKSGVVNTLAYTPNGGLVSKLEVVEYKGSGNIIITGNTGEIMDESVNVAISYIKNNYKHQFNNMDLHFHFLDATTKKDGPSAGVAITMAILSILEKKQIPENVAFTGEISLNGNILKVGGLKEKLIGAYNKNIKVVHIPNSNLEDLEDIPKIIKDKIDVIPVTNLSELYTKYFK